MADTQISPLAVEAAPADWVLPDAQVVTIGALFAHFDGSGAAGPFVPTVQIISDSGNTVMEVPQDTTVAAGAEVEATWAPFLKGAAPAASAIAWAKIDSRSTAITVQNVNTLILPDATDSFSTSDSSVFDEASQVVAGTTYKGVRLLKNGVYLAWVGFNYTGAGAGDTIRGYYTQGGGNTDGFYIGTDRMVFPSPGFANSATWGWMEAYQMDPVTSPVPAVPQLFYGRNDGSASGHVSATAFYVYLGAGLLFP